jgi:hypothetical protein
LVSDVIRYLAGLRPVDVSTLKGRDEVIGFKLPLDLALVPGGPALSAAKRYPGLV